MKLNDPVQNKSPAASHGLRPCLNCHETCEQQMPKILVVAGQ